MRTGQVDIPLIISLDENPSTGYLWYIEPQIDMCVLSTKYIPPVGNEIGGGGQREFRIVFDQPGKYQIVAFQKRQWEVQHISSKNFEVNIE